MRKSGSPVRSLIVLASVVGLAVVPTYTAPAPAAQALVPVPIVGFGPADRLATGDLNGDGHADLVGALFGTPWTNVGVAISDGAGGFSSVTGYFSGIAPTAVAVADMNGDGRQDVVVNNGQGHVSVGSVAVLLADGTGALGAPVTYPLGFLRAVTAGDFTGDAVPDVAVLNGTSLTILANDGAGNLSHASTVAVNPAGSTLFSIAAADFDQDRKLDVAIVSYSQVFHTNTSLTTFRGNGDGTFGARVDYKSNAQGGGYFSFGTQFADLAIGDMNDDGYPDIVVTSQGHTVFPLAAAGWVMLNNGAGEFPSPPLKYLQPVGVTGVAVGDMNDDGAPDVVIGDVRGASVDQLFNDGTGALGGAVRTTTGAIWVVLGDFNNSGAGTLDIVVSRGGADPAILLIGTSTATSCATGTYSASGNEPCTLADPGYFVATEGATSQTACPSGSFSGLNGSIECTLAPAGSFVAGPAATYSLLCPAGTYSASAGATACTPADAGSYVPAPGSTSQTACPTGYSSDGGAIECYPVDTDGDGVNDIDDAYPNSNMHPTVQVGACTAGVANLVLPNGATFNDLLAGVSGANHGQRVSAVSALSNGWKGAGLISGRDHGAIVSCVARSK